MAGKVKYEIDPVELKALYQTHTMRQIAERYGCGESTIWARIKLFGIEHEGFGDLGHRHRKREFSEEHRRRMSAARKGKFGAQANGNWKGGISSLHTSLRRSVDYQIWRRSALELRGSACQECGKVEGSVCDCCGTRIKLHVHHVRSFAKFPESRFDPQNSEVLCPGCHHSRHRGKPGELLETP